jgi:hypothetical protein
LIAALYVERNGCYANLVGVDVWDRDRDARTYAGPYPVVAHPPCQRWGRLGAANYARWGGEHNRPGNDGGCFAAALASVRRWGGVLEHPASSMAWSAHNLLAPTGYGWNGSGDGWVCEVWQSSYGHKARKATWLYYVGASLPPVLNWHRRDGTHQVGFQDRRGKERNKPTLSSREAAATPVEFRDLLLSIARAAEPMQAAA